MRICQHEPFDQFFAAEIPKTEEGRAAARAGAHQQPLEAEAGRGGICFHLLKNMCIFLLGFNVFFFFFFQGAYAMGCLAVQVTMETWDSWVAVGFSCKCQEKRGSSILRNTQMRS